MKRFASIIETIPTPCRVCGTVLRPFSLGHHLLFTRLGLPFADNPQADCDVEQFLQGVFTCANSYEENLDGHLSGEWAKRFEKWSKAVRKTKPDYKDALEMFRRHISEGYRIAPVWRHQATGAGITMSAPWEQLLKVRLIAAGFSLSEIMNGYLPERWYDYYTFAELTQLESCTDSKNWRKIFYTLKDALDDDAASQVEPMEEKE